jgi:hypothetical protein
MIEMLELDALECALPKPEVEQQAEREPITNVLLRRNDATTLIRIKRRAVHTRLARALDRQCRIAVQLSSQHRPLEKVTQNRKVLVVRARSAAAPLLI